MICLHREHQTTHTQKQTQTNKYRAMKTLHVHHRRRHRSFRLRVDEKRMCFAYNYGLYIQYVLHHRKAARKKLF